MATKYTRESEVWEERDARKTPWMRQGPLLRPLSRKQRLFIVLAGFAAVVLLAQIALQLNRSASYAFQQVYRGTGTVVAQGPDEAGGGLVTLEVDLGEGRSMQAPWRIPSPYWEEIEVGSRLAVLYQIHKLGREIRIVECGVVALKEDIR